MLIKIICLLVCIGICVDGNIQVGIKGFPWMTYINPNEIILSGGTLVPGFTLTNYGWYCQSQEIYSYNPSNNITNFIGGSSISSGQEDGIGSNAVFRVLGLSIPYYNKSGNLLGYLLPDRCSVRFMNLNIPGLSSSPFGFNSEYSCSSSLGGNSSYATMGFISSIAITNYPDGYVYAISDYDFNIIYTLSGNSSFMTSKILLNHSIDKINSIVFVNNALVNGILIKEIPDNLWDILIIADNLNGSRLSYYYKNQIKTITYIGNNNSCISSMKIYYNDTNTNIPYFLITKYNESNKSIYYGNDLAKLTTPCVSMNNLSIDTLILPNGTVIGTENMTGIMYTMTCILNIYNSSLFRLGSEKTKSNELTTTTTTTKSRLSSLSNLYTKNSNSISSSKSNIYTYSNSKTISERITTEVYITKSVSKSVNILAKKPTNSSSHSHTHTYSHIHIHTKTTSDIHTYTYSHYNSYSHTYTISKKKLDKSISKSKSNSYSNSYAKSKSTNKINIYPNLNPLIMPVSITSNVVAVISGINGGRTSIFLSILSGKCGATRDLEIYENPFQTDYVVFGDIGFMIITVMAMLLVGGFIDVFSIDERRYKIRISETLVKYKVVDILFIEWGLFLPGIITSFFKYRGTIYYDLDTSLGIIFLLSTIILTLLGMTKVFVLKIQETISVSVSIFEESVSWMKDIIPSKKFYEPTGELVIPVVEGYTSKFNMYLDVGVSIVCASITVIDNCSYLGIASVSINIIYSIYIFTKNTIQPRTMVYANCIFAIGQSIVIIIVMVGFYNTSTNYIFYLITILGILAMFLPFMRKVSHWFMRKKENVNINLASLQDEMLKEISNI